MITQRFTFSLVVWHPVLTFVHELHKFTNQFPAFESKLSCWLSLLLFFWWKIKGAPVRSLRKKLTRKQVARNSSRPQFTAFHKFLKPFATLRFLCYPAQQYSTATGFRWQWMLTSCVLLTAISNSCEGFWHQHTLIWTQSEVHSHYNTSVIIGMLWLPRRKSFQHYQD